MKYIYISNRNYSISFGWSDPYEPEVNGLVADDSFEPLENTHAGSSYEKNFIEAESLFEAQLKLCALWNKGGSYIPPNLWENDPEEAQSIIDWEALPYTEEEIERNLISVVSRHWDTMGKDFHNYSVNKLNKKIEALEERLKKSEAKIVSLKRKR